MKPVVIGFDTSCYTTSVAAANPDGHLVCSCRKLLPVETGERGLRQSDAVFLHVRQLPDLIRQVSEQIRGYDITLVCASTKPRKGEDSYMPVFTVGKTMGEAMASVLNVPFVETDHQQGHFAAAAYESGINTDQPYLAVHLSGGTTDLVLISEDRLELLGTSHDLHAGQLVDRIGVAMGMKFPAGPELEKLAMNGTAKALIPSSITNDGLSCHLSGAEAACMRMIRDHKMPEADIAAEVFDCLARTISKMILNGMHETGISQILLAGGVSSSALFRSMVTERIRKSNRNAAVCFGHPEYSGDNAAGVALIGASLSDRSDQS